MARNETMKIVIDAEDKASRDIRKIRDAFKKGGVSAENAAKQIGTINKSLRQTKIAAGTATGSMAGLTSGISNFTKGIALGNLAAIGMTAAIGAVATGLKKMAGALANATLIASEVEELGAVLNFVGQRAGYTTTQIDGYVSALRKNGIAQKETNQSLLRAIQGNIALADAVKLGRIAQDAAVIGQVNSSEAFQTLIDAVVKGRLVMLKSLGIQGTFEQAYKDLAVTLGKSAVNLTEVERKQARLNLVFKGGKVIAGAYATSMGFASKQLRSMDRHVQDLQVSVGKFFQIPFALGVTAITLAVKSATVALDSLFWAATSVIGLVVDIGDEADTTEGKFKRWSDEVDRLTELLRSRKITITEFREEMSKFGQISLISEEEIDQLADAAEGLRNVADATKVVTHNQEQLNKLEKEFQEQQVFKEKKIQAAALANALERLNTSVKTTVSEMGKLKSIKIPKVEVEPVDTAGAVKGATKALKLIERIRIDGLSAFHQKEIAINEKFNDKQWDLQIAAAVAGTSSHSDVMAAFSQNEKNRQNALTAHMLSNTKDLAKKLLESGMATEKQKQNMAEALVRDTLGTVGIGMLNGLISIEDAKANMFATSFRRQLFKQEEFNQKKKEIEKFYADNARAIGLRGELSHHAKILLILENTENRKAEIAALGAEERKEIRQREFNNILNGLTAIGNLMDTFFSGRQDTDEERFQANLDQQAEFNDQDYALQLEHRAENDALREEEFGTEAERKEAEAALNDIHRTEQKDLQREITEESFRIQQELSKRTTGQKIAEAGAFIKNTVDQIGAIGKFGGAIISFLSTLAAKTAADATALALTTANSVANTTLAATSTVVSTAQGLETSVTMGLTSAYISLASAKAAASLGLATPAIITAGLTTKAALAPLMVPLGFDDRINDLLAEDSGEDYANFFMKGAGKVWDAPHFGNMVVAAQQKNSMGMYSPDVPGPVTVNRHINIHFVGNMMDEDFIKKEAIPQIEQAIRDGESGIMLNELGPSELRLSSTFSGDGRGEGGGIPSRTSPVVGGGA